VRVGSLAENGGRVRLEELLGRRVRFKGEEGRIVEGHAGEEASVVVNLPARTGSPRRTATVPEAEWEQLELLD
jgi:hypothetical protein